MVCGYGHQQMMIADLKQELASVTGFEEPLIAAVPLLAAAGLRYTDTLPVIGAKKGTPSMSKEIQKYFCFVQSLPNHTGKLLSRVSSHDKMDKKGRCRTVDRETEKMMKELQQFLALHEEEVTDEDSLERLADRFLSEYDSGHPRRKDAVPETADDYMELAEQASSKKKSLEYLHKALELEPENVDAQLQLISITLKDKPDEQLPALRQLMDAAARQLEQEGCFKEDVGDFWGVPETRPYMRVRYTYFYVLISCGMIRYAISEGEELLRLCENDNLGVRYQLMHLYAYTEDEMHALALHKRFDSYEETQMLLPLAVLYYKLNQFEQAEDHIKRLAAVNKDMKKFLRAAAGNQLDQFLIDMDPYGYRPFTMDELLTDLMTSTYLFASVPYFFRWASGCLRTQRAAGKRKAAPKTKD